MKKPESIKDIDNAWELIAYLVSYRIKELIILLLGAMISIYLFINIQYDKKGGLQWKPAPVSVEIKRGQ